MNREEAGAMARKSLLDAEIIVGKILTDMVDEVEHLSGPSDRQRTVTLAATLGVLQFKLAGVDKALAKVEPELHDMIGGLVAIMREKLQAGVDQAIEETAEKFYGRKQ